jgi:hypothetical protein
MSKLLWYVKCMEKLIVIVLVLLVFGCAITVSILDRPPANNGGEEKWPAVILHHWKW